MKTTIVGLLLAMLTALQPYLENGEIDFGKNWVQYLIAMGVAGLGFLAKDPNRSFLSREGESDSDIGGGGIKNPTKP